MHTVLFIKLLLVTPTGDLHRLLHWRQNIERLPSILTAMTKVPGDEIVKVSVINHFALYHS